MLNHSGAQHSQFNWKKKVLTFLTISLFQFICTLQNMALKNNHKQYMEQIGYSSRL